MPRPRVPLAKAIITGRTKHDPQRFRNRKEPQIGEPLGGPPKWLTPSAKLAWSIYEKECPWLNGSHRSLVEIASYLRGKTISGDELSINGFNLLRQILGAMGATPADASKITMPNEPDDEADPATAYF